MQIKKLETVNKANELLAEIYINHPELTELDNMLQIATNRDLSNDELSRCTVKMSAMLIRFGEWMTNYVTLANESYIYRKFRFLWEYTSLSKFKGKERENMAMDATFKEYEDELINRHVADYLKTKFEQYNKFVNVLQSKLAIRRVELNKNIE